MKDTTFGLVEVYSGNADAMLGPVDGPVTVTWQGYQEGGTAIHPSRKPWRQTTARPVLHHQNSGMAR
ncbi:hypothetical protein [Roseovarius sp. Pro17]|uniref:hypothetical protein n=1 Tax=Roseovarius sp. Pro17 TaxID=3108175 RepID=UPI002D766E5B|nr:hypothetical protein [Roseovarius sp. Pro17]